MQITITATGMVIPQLGGESNIRGKTICCNASLRLVFLAADWSGLPSQYDNPPSLLKYGCS